MTHIILLFFNNLKIIMLTKFINGWRKENPPIVQEHQEER